MKLTKIVRELITLAKAANRARLTEGPDDDSPLLTYSGDTATINLRTTEERRLHEFLAIQPPSVVFMLTAIMNLGRGDFEANALVEHCTEIGEIFGDSTLAARDLLTTMPLAEFLESGLQRLKRAGIDLDKLAI